MKFEFPADKISAIRSLLSQPKKIVITTHHRPDGDAIGSCLALYHFLVSDGHELSVITPDEAPDFLKWLPGSRQVICHDKNVQPSETKVKEAEIIFCLDFNRLDRLDKLSDAVSKSKAKKILIDHHLDPETSFDFIFSHPESCATCELIYYFITALDNAKVISKSVAACIYTGIMTDTQSFRFSNMTADTHRVIANLIEARVENHVIHENVYDSYSEHRLRLLGYCINNKLKVLKEYKTAFITLSKEELDRFHFASGDSEGFVNYALAIDGIRLAGFFMELDGIIKISLRSKGNFSVKEMAEKYFEGGGHKNAAGGQSELLMEATVEKFITTLKHYSKELNACGLT
ncbi:MAG TPA: bifunctional oligoribonuclease/PAP phosphatase NrnA [Bacteroidia bacterium]|nr:bifunctional oligoribonuclease/PAP phosphatase NrnA [Bacteroidia bacterium]